MFTDPASRKRQEALLEIQTVLEDETLPSKIKDALHTTWRHIDSQDRLRITSKRNYIRYARLILRRLPTSPTEWTPETLIDIMDMFRRKPDGSEFSSRYRNLIRTTIHYVLDAFDRKDIKHIIRDESTRISQAMQIQTISKPVDQFDSVERIMEEHMRAVVSQMKSDRVRVIFWVMWDIGARPDDIKMMTLGDVEFDNEGVGVVLWVPNDTKTGRRPTRPRYSLPVLRKYLTDHPYAIRKRDGSFKDSGVALFINTHGNAWSTTRSISRHLREAIKKVRVLEKDSEWPFAPLPETMTCQALRINAVNRDMDEGISIEANAVHHGHSVKVMMDVYRRRDRKALVMKEIDAAAGIIHDDAKPREQWRTCPTCHHQNPPLNDFCALCGSPVTVDAMRMREEQSKERERRIAKTVLDMILEKSEEKGLLP